MKDKVVKYWSDLFKKEITMTIDKKLNNMDESKMAPRKQELANQQLEKIKDSLPK